MYREKSPATKVLIEFDQKLAHGSSVRWSHRNFCVLCVLGVSVFQFFSAEDAEEHEALHSTRKSTTFPPKIPL